MSQIIDEKIYDVDGAKIKGENIKAFIRRADDKLLGRFHNEVNLNKPNVNAFVAKVKTIEEIPDEFLDFVYKYDLPIFILGK